jgi:hypothetical protein
MRLRIFGLLALGSLALFALSASSLAGAEPAAVRGPTGVAQYLPAGPDPGASCSRVRKIRVKGVLQLTGTSTSRDVLCGGNESEHFYPLGGHDTVLAGGGDDRVFDDPSNATSDLISGGPGRKDWARHDPCDDVSGIETQVVKGRRKACSARRRAGQQAVDYGTIAFQARVECGSFSTAGLFSMRVSEEPMIRAVDTSRKIDWQFVSWIPLLYRFDGTQWVHVPVGNAFWLWDWTVDLQDNEFDQVRNFWRARIKGRTFRSRTGFTVPAGTYTMDIRYRWFKTARTPNHQQDYHAGLHFGEYETDNTHRSCTFPAATPASAARSAGGYALSQFSS